MPRTLLIGARVVDPGPADAPPADAIELDGDRVTWVGAAAEARQRSAGAQVLDLAGAVVTPAFVDAHVHATATGLLVDGLDLAGCPSPTALLDAVAARAAARPGALIWGHGWQEQHWADPPPARSALDRAAAGAPVYLSRVDVHSALVSSALLDRAPGAAGEPGWSDGPLSASAHHHARRAALAAVDGRTRAAAQEAFLAKAAARGIAVVHECAGPDISSADDLAELRARPGPQVVGYWGEAVTTAAQARELLVATGALLTHPAGSASSAGCHPPVLTRPAGSAGSAGCHPPGGLAGDLFVDGSIGSRTAALRTPYADAPGCTGNRYLDAGAIGAHVAACTEAGVQAGFHVIGDAAADALVEGLEIAASATSFEAVRAARHRVEHLEMVEPAQAARLAALGVTASVQPLFDALWGGPSGMYAERLGAGRAAPMNPFAALREAGVVLAFGSDTPVTPVGPWDAVRAAVAHRTPGSGLSAAGALAAHTVGGHRAAGDRSPLAGRLVAGAPATYAVWDGPGPLDGDPRAPLCLRTMHQGRVLHDTLSGVFPDAPPAALPRLA